MRSDRYPVSALEQHLAQLSLGVSSIADNSSPSVARSSSFFLGLLSWCSLQTPIPFGSAILDPTIAVPAPKKLRTMGKPPDIEARAVPLKARVAAVEDTVETLWTKFEGLATPEQQCKSGDVCEGFRKSTGSFVMVNDIAQEIKLEVEDLRIATTSRIFSTVSDDTYAVWDGWCRLRLGCCGLGRFARSAIILHAVWGALCGQ